MAVNNKEMVPFEHYVERWKTLNPVEAAERCGVKYDAETGTFTVRLLKTNYTLHWPEFSIASERGDAFALKNLPAQIFMMRYLLEGRAAACSGSFLPYREMPWGEVYIKPFTGRVLTRAAFTFGTRIDAFVAAGEKIGAIALDKGDASIQMEIMPGYDVRLIVWEGDDEFPPNAQMLFSDNFPQGFDAEDRTVTGDILISELKRHL